MFYVYVIKSLKTNRFYYGFTSNIDNRIKKHNSGNVKSTKLGYPWVLINFKPFENKIDALAFEKKLKYSYNQRLKFRSIAG